MVGNKAQKAVAAALTGMLALGSAAPAFAGVQIGPAANNWYRINGDMDTAYWDTFADTGLFGFEDYKGKDRYDTMFDATSYNANATHGNVWMTGTIDTVVLVSGTSYADALSANALAGNLGAPLITTPADELGIQAERIIKAYAQASPTTNADGNPMLTVYIVGGTSAVSAEVEDAINDIDSVKTVAGSTAVEVNASRIGGGDRMETSLFVARFVDANLGASNTPDRVFVANGYAWADALSVSSYSYRQQTPLLLTDSAGNLTAQQIKWLKNRSGKFDIDVIGGPAKLAFDALNAIDGIAGTANFIAGADRYLTSAEVVRQLGLNGGLPAAAQGTNLAVATGKNWPDALIGGAFIGAQDGTLVLIGEASEDKNWDAAIARVIDQQDPADTPTPVALNNKYVMGGTAAISRGTANALVNTLN